LPLADDLTFAFFVLMEIYLIESLEFEYPKSHTKM